MNAPFFCMTGRSCEQAILKLLDYFNDGYEWIVDIDLEKFFDNVPQDRLMSLVNVIINDGDTESLIRKYLQAGVMVNGHYEETNLGTPQGGNLSPLLSNIMLNELDKELDARGLRFTRYADDCVIVVKSESSEKRVMRTITDYIERKLGLKVVLDVNPEFFAKAGASPNDISVFHMIQADVLRMDIAFSEEDNLKLLQNPYGIKIMFNASAAVRPEMIQSLITKGADPERILVGHNFYQQRYTGMKWEKFLKLSKEFHDTGALVEAFITSHNEPTHGVWDARCGLCTVERMRDLPIDLQYRELAATGVIDDICIGNAYASDQEFEDIQKSAEEFEPDPENPIIKTLIKMGAKMESFHPQKKIKVCLEPEITTIEKEILFDFFPHSDVGDSSEWIWHSRMPRFFYRDKAIPARKSEQLNFQPGSVLMVNDNYKHYAGEVQIAFRMEK